MNLDVRSGIMLAAVTALVVVLAAWFLPWREIISGDEQLAPARMPQTRQEVTQAASNFDQVNAQYQAYIKTHDLAALLNQSEAAIQRAQVDPSNDSNLVAVHDVVAQVRDYAQVLETYARASDAYLSALRNYDDDLMSWTRGLFSASESLRSQTWPFVEHLKLYPQPLGLKTDPPMVTMGQVGAQIDSLEAHSAALKSGASADANKQALDGISQDIANIWESGRSVEYVAGLHTDYRDELATYDTKVQEAAQGPETVTGPSNNRASAWGLTVAVSLLTLGGIMALFMPKTEIAT
jgi:hypothetical protein